MERYVLVVDNDEAICDLTVTTLRDAGIAAVSVADTTAALELCRQSPPALILLDTMNATVSDVEFIQTYRALPGPHGPVILFSAWDQPERHAAAIGANGVLTKPFELDTFVERIRLFLGRL
ncbi:MAG TPA: response regulator [Chloroflexota bacterium]|nr:response regulator [Chloroflexota bacterium]